MHFIQILYKRITGQGTEYFNFTNFSTWNFIYIWKLLHTLKETGRLCLCCGHKFRVIHKFQMIFTSSRGNKSLSKPVCAVLGWMLWLKSKLSYSEAYRDAKQWDKKKNTIKTKMSHKPEPSPCLCHYLFLLPPWKTPVKQYELPLTRKLAWIIF